MTRGKKTCKILKEIRREIAKQNDIEYITQECGFKGECKGTCPKCEAELRYLENELRKRRQLGKAVTIAGISLGMAGAMAAQNPSQRDSISAVEQIVVAPDRPSRQFLGEIVPEGPTFPGGDSERLKVLKENLQYPEEDAKAGTQGTVWIQFTVNEDGTLSNFKVARSVSTGLDAEALRVAKLMPNWNPGRQLGEPVVVSFKLPIKFTLEKNKKQ